MVFNFECLGYCVKLRLPDVIWWRLCLRPRFQGGTGHGELVGTSLHRLGLVTQELCGENTAVNGVSLAKWHLDLKTLLVKLFGLCSGEAAVLGGWGGE